MERENKSLTEKYPHAHPKTYEFLKAVIAEGSHLKKPPRFVFSHNLATLKMRGVHNSAELTTEELREADWVRMRNIAGVYFSSPATLSDLADQYGFTNRERPRQIIKKFIEYLWRNSSDEIRSRFSLEEVLQPKPKVLRKLRMYERKLGALTLLAEAGKPIDEIALSVEIPTSSVARIIRRERNAGRLKLSEKEEARVFNLRLERMLSNLPGNFSAKQAILDKVSFTFYRSHPEKFMTLTECCRLAQVEIGPTREMEKIREIFKKAEIPQGRIALKKWRPRAGYYDTSCNFILINDLDRALETTRSVFGSCSRLASQIKNPPEDSNLRQGLLDKITPALQLRLQREGLIISVGRLLRDIGISTSAQRIVEAAEQLRNHSVPIGEVSRLPRNNTRKYHSYFVLRPDYELLVLAYKNRKGN